MKARAEFRHLPNRRPATDEQVARILVQPGFGRHFTDHMVTAEFDRARGWHDAEVRPHQPLSMPPGTAVFHYGQAIFEGLKAYRQPDGSVACFRPDMNAARFGVSARRLAMPELPEETFLRSLAELVAVDERWVPAGEGKSLYLRPLMISTCVGLSVTPSDEYLYVLIASPVSSYFGSGVSPVSVWLSQEYVRAAPGGTGFAKCAGNYGAAFIAQQQATEQGCDQVVWLDAAERRWVEEMGGMNLFFVFGSGPGACVVTPELTGSLLPGVTRDSLLRLARDDGYEVAERRISVQEWAKAAASGELTEVFACGTAAGLTPVGKVRHADGEVIIGAGKPGPVTTQLRRRLIAIQTGAAPDPYGWMRTLVGASLCVPVGHRYGKSDYNGAIDTLTTAVIGQRGDRAARGMGAIAAAAPGARSRRASPATVGSVNRSRSGRSRPKRSPSRFTIRAACRDWPPRMKKSSSAPIGAVPSTCDQIAATVRSTSSAGSRNAWSSGRGSGRAPSAARSTFPLSVRGSSATGTMRAGTMYSGSSAPTCPRRSWPLTAASFSTT
jgi:branched-chain amino acid aminotransferase